MGMSKTQFSKQADFATTTAALSTGLTRRQTTSVSKMASSEMKSVSSASSQQMSSMSSSSQFASSTQSSSFSSVQQSSAVNKSDQKKNCFFGFVVLRGIIL